MNSINVNGWLIQSFKKPISNATELDTLQSSLPAITLPEMTYGANYLSLSHPSSGFCYRFDTLGALAQVKSGSLIPEDGPVKVAYAEEWLKSRSANVACRFIRPSHMQ